MADKGPRQCSCKFEICHDRNPKLSRFPPNQILVLQYPMRCWISFVAWNVDYQSNLSVLEVVHYVRFLLLAHLVQYPALDSVLRKLFRRMLCCEYSVACSRQHSSIGENSFSRFTHRDEDGIVFLWNIEVACGQGVDERVLEGLAETGHFSGRDHFDPGDRVGLIQSCKGELWSFHSDSLRNSFAGLYGPVGYCLSGQIHQVCPNCLGYEWHASRGSKVAFDNEGLSVLDEELDVEGSLDIETSSYCSRVEKELLSHSLGY